MKLSLSKNMHFDIFTAIAQLTRECISVITSWVCGFNDDLGNDEAGLELSVSDAIKCSWSKQLE